MANVSVPNIGSISVDLFQLDLASDSYSRELGSVFGSDLSSTFII